MTTRRILVVDDSTLLHSMFKLILGRLQDTRVVFAAHGQEALETIARDGEPSLILLDINMPVMNGLEFLGHLSQKGVQQRVPVIIVSTEGKEEDVLRGLEAGARGYLRKPFRPQELHDIINKVLA